MATPVFVTVVGTIPPAGEVEFLAADGTHAGAVCQHPRMAGYWLAALPGLRLRRFKTRAGAIAFLLREIAK